MPKVVAWPTAAGGSVTQVVSLCMQPVSHQSSLIIQKMLNKAWIHVVEGRSVDGKTKQQPDAPQSDTSGCFDTKPSRNVGDMYAFWRITHPASQLTGKRLPRWMGGTSLREHTTQSTQCSTCPVGSTRPDACIRQKVGFLHENRRICGTCDGQRLWDWGFRTEVPLLH